MAPPTESQILSSYLLTPASLPTIIPLDQFRTLFPKNLRQHPHIKVLYRDLQFLRSVDIDVVRENIAQEVRRGDRMRMTMWRALNTGEEQSRNGGAGMKREEMDEMALEREMDVQLFGPSTSNLPQRNDSHQQQHSLESLLEEMERAAEVLEAEAEEAEKDADGLVGEIGDVVGGLSDLRYGSFANAKEGGGVGEEVRRALGRLGEVISD